MSLQSSASFAAAVSRASSVDDVVRHTLAAIDCPSVFFFGDLLQALHASHHTQGVSGDVMHWRGVVDLLTYATIRDVDACTPGVKALIASHPVITEKLRILSLLTLCSQHAMSTMGICLAYDAVAHATGVKGTIEVQAIVLAAVQRKLCTARLDERAATVRVLTYESRDVKVSEVAALRQRLEEWSVYAEAQLR